jgi:(R,R)-butanediol dehydrogenase/meso-butanediol dehydrogenase/diacetyl reductase
MGNVHHGSPVVDPSANFYAQLPAPGEPLQIGESEVPKAGSGEVVIRVSYCGLCGSDLHSLEHPESFPKWAANDKDNPLEDVLSPGFTGHEYSGVIDSVGPDVVGWSPGDRVVGRARQACGSCPRCLSADPINCTNQWRPPGKAYARYMTVRASMLHEIPAEVDLRLAALATPLAECLHSLEAAHWSPGMSAIVSGAGPMGLCTIALLAHSGVAPLIVTEPNPARRELAASFGAIAVAPRDGLDVVLDATNGNGLDVGFECAGSIPAFDTVLSSLRQGGRLVIVGLAPDGAIFELQPRSLWERRIEILIGGAPESTLDRALKLLPLVAAERLIAEVYPLSQINEAFESFQNGRPGKLLIAPWAGPGSDDAGAPTETRKEP